MLYYLQIILLNFRQELSILAETSSGKTGVDDCSDVMVQQNLTGKAFLGHNEDNTIDTRNTSYFVQATLVSLLAKALQITVYAFKALRVPTFVCLKHLAGY